MTNNCSSNCNCSSNKNKPCADSCNPNTTTTVYYQPFSDPNECCCRNSLIKAFQAIQQAVASVGIPGFGVELLITTITGTTYTVFVSSGTAIPLVVTCEAIVYGNLAINLDDIAKIQILSGLTGNPTFINNLLTLLRNITSCNRPYNCPIAVTVDEEDEGSSLMRGCCNNCNRPYNQCGCGNNGFYCGTRPPTNQCPPTPTPPYSVSNTGLQDFINRNASSLSSINFLGSNELIENITFIDTIADTTVLNSAILTETIASAVTDVTLVAGANTTVVNNITTTPIDVVTSVTFSNVTIPSIVESITFSVGTVVAGFDAVETTIVVAGVTSVAPVDLGAISTGLITTDLAGAGLYIVIPTGALDGTIPAAPITLPVYVSISTGLTPVILSQTTVETIDADTTLLSVEGTPSLVPALTSLGAATEVSVLTSLSADSVVDVSIINGITTTTTTIEELDVISSISIPSVNTISISSGLFVSDVELTTSTTLALTGVGVNTISITSSTPESIPGTVQAVGSGLVVVQDSIGNITLYSVCKIDSVTSLN